MGGTLQGGFCSILWLCFFFFFSFGQMYIIIHNRSFLFSCILGSLTSFGPLHFIDSFGDAGLERRFCVVRL